jgi:hypothetical protein
MCLTLLLLWAVDLAAQSSSFVAITPQSATLFAGESRSFRLVDQNGQMQRNVTWTISDPDALQAKAGDELTVTAKLAGNFRVSARSENGAAEATVEVVEGQIPVGTAIWTTPTAPGCKSVKLDQAMPSANGPDLYDTSHCPDGDYVTAMTSDGKVLWRRKLGGAIAASAATRAVAPASLDGKPAAAGRINVASTSICDSVSVGTDERKIRDLLHQRNLSFSEGSSGERMWIVEESNRQCKLWFDDKLVLMKKRKIFVTD